MFYLLNDAVWAVDIDSSGDVPLPGTPRELFKTRLRVETPGGSPYDVSRDGQRFLLKSGSTPAGGEAVSGGSSTRGGVKETVATYASEGRSGDHLER